MPILVPRIEGEFSAIYLPPADVFEGPDAVNLKAGVVYDDWIPNDHSIIRGPDGAWHLFGITGPSSPIHHEAEWMSLHAVLEGNSLSDSLGRVLWQERPKLLYPAERPGERNALYAPFCVKSNGLYHLFYGPEDIRRATSTDLYHWTPRGAVFTQAGGARDPYLFRHDGLHYMAYVAYDSVFLRSSPDLVVWSDPREIYSMPFEGSPESPFIVAHDDGFYLFWCIYDGGHPYDARTFVFRSETLLNFSGRAPIAMLRAHAPEVIRDDDGEWYITSAEWPVRGISMARLVWDVVEV